MLLLVVGDDVFVVVFDVFIVVIDFMLQQAE